MDFKDKTFEVEFTDKCIKEIINIYDYISTELKENRTAIKLISTVNEKILNLKTNPELYMKVGKVDKLKREYHRIVIKNYVILYTVDYNQRKIFISHMIYGKRNYLK